MKNKKALIIVGILVVIVIVAVIIANSMNYKNKTITASNYETIISEAKDSSLTDEEKEQFASGLLKYILNPDGIYGKKVKDIIKEGKNILGNTESYSSKDDSDKRTMEEFVQKFKDEGCEIDLNEKPLYSFIGASDGVIFYLNNSPVKIYKYNSEKSYSEAKKDNAMLENCEKNGLFVLDTNSEKAKEIFKQI